MADSADKEKAEKLAAAKKRVEHLKKQKEKAKKAGGKKPDDKPAAKEESPSALEQVDVQGDEASSTKNGEIFQETPTEDPQDENLPNTRAEDKHETPFKPPHTRQPSLSLQSRMRSSSFRRTSVSQGPLSPTTNATKSPSLPPLSSEGDAVTEIYRKQASRLDELEKENRRLAKEAGESESRWRKTEEELEELREANGEVAELKSRAGRADAKDEEAEKLRTEITSLQRQMSHLQSQTSKPRNNSSPSQAPTPSSDLQAQLDSKSSTIDSMEMEISNLRTQLDKTASATNAHKEQVSALEDKLDRAERAAGAAQRELADVKKGLDRASEKAVKEGSERTSAETKIRSLEREAEESRKSAEESMKRVETLEKKLAALTTLHKESDARRRDGERDRERAEKEIGDLKRRLAGLENDNLRLREERERTRKRDASGADDDGVDALEDEERKRLERRVRDLESEASDLRRGLWRSARSQLDPPGGSPGSNFDDIDLDAGPSPLRGQSLEASNPVQTFSHVLSSGLSAFTGGGGARTRAEGLDDDEDEEGGGFDEEAFGRAQEEEARMRVERVREVKRGLGGWGGWRLDVVDTRGGGGGAGEVFEV